MAVGELLEAWDVTGHVVCSVSSFCGRTGAITLPDP